MGTPGFWASRCFALAQIGIIFLEVSIRAEVHCLPPCERDHWTQRLWQQALTSVCFYFPPCLLVPMKGFLNSTPHPIFHSVIKSHPNGRPRGSFPPRHSHSVVPRQAALPGHSWGMQVRGPCPTPTESGRLGVGPSNLRESEASFRLRNSTSHPLPTSFAGRDCKGTILPSDSLKNPQICDYILHFALWLWKPHLQLAFWS